MDVRYMSRWFVHPSNHVLAIVTLFGAPEVL